VANFPVPASQDAATEGEEGSPSEGAADAAVAGQQGDRPPVGPGALVPAMRTVVSDLAHALCTQVKATSCYRARYPPFHANYSPKQPTLCGILRRIASPVWCRGICVMCADCSLARYVVAHMRSFLNLGVMRTHAWEAVAATGRGGGDRSGGSAPAAGGRQREAAAPDGRRRRPHAVDAAVHGGFPAAGRRVGTGDASRAGATVDFQRIVHAAGCIS